MIDELMNRIKKKPERPSNNLEIEDIPTHDLEIMHKGVERNTRVFSRKRKNKNPNNSSEFRSAKKTKKGKTTKKESIRSELPLRFLKQSIGPKKSRERRDEHTQLSSRPIRMKSREESLNHVTHSPRSKLPDKSYSRALAGLTPGGNYSMNQFKKPKREEISKKSSADKKSARNMKPGLSLTGSDSRTKLKLNSLYLGNTKKEKPIPQAKSTERTKLESSTERLNLGGEGVRSSGKLVKLTFNTSKSTMPLVQINNIVGDIRESSQINRSSNFTSRTETAIYRPAKEAFRSSDSRAKSRKSPSIEIALDSERTRISSILKKNQAYDKKLIANYLQRNRLVNL